MFNFKEWLIFCEQPHIHTKSPLNFRLNGMPYRNIVTIDPRIERWPDLNIKKRFFKYLIGSKDADIQPKSIFFTDDDSKVFEIKPSNVAQISQEIPDMQFIMPAYWHHFAQFRNQQGDFIDNTEPNFAIQNIAI